MKSLYPNNDNDSPINKKRLQRRLNHAMKKKEKRSHDIIFHHIGRYGINGNSSSTTNQVLTHAAKPMVKITIRASCQTVENSLI